MKRFSSVAVLAFLIGCVSNPEEVESEEDVGAAGPKTAAGNCTFSDNEMYARLNDHYANSRHGKNCPYAGQPGGQLVAMKVAKNLTAAGKVAAFVCSDGRHKGKKKSNAYVCLGELDKHQCDCKGEIHDWHILTYHEFHCAHGHGIGRPVWRSAAVVK